MPFVLLCGSDVRQASGKYLVAILDADGVLAEMNESNNAVTWGRF